MEINNDISMPKNYIYKYKKENPIIICNKLNS